MMLNPFFALLFRIIPESYREDILGDLLEEYQELRTRMGEGRAKRWLQRRVLSTISMNLCVRALALFRPGARIPHRGRIGSGPGRSGSGSAIMESLFHDVRSAARIHTKRPFLALVAISTLGLGIGASTAMFSVLEAVWGRSLPYPQPDRLVVGRATFNGALNPWVSFPNYMDYRDQARSLASLAAIGMGSFPETVTGNGEPEEARVVQTTANLFETLNVAPEMGTTFSIEEQPEGGGGEVVISHGFWQRWFGGDPDVVGRSLSVDGESLTVMGVMPAGFRFLYDVDLWKPPWPGNSNPDTRLYTNWLVVGRLAKGLTLDEARSEVEVIGSQLREAYPDTNQGRALQLDGLHSVVVEGVRVSLLVLTGAVIFLLLIACGNVASLLMARASTRTSELAVKAALGAGTGRLTRQLLTECILLALAGGSLGVVLAIWLQEIIVGLLPLDLLGTERVGMSGTMLGLALALSLGTVLLFGILPSLIAAKVNPAIHLRNGLRGSTSGGGIRLRSGLVVVQVALSLVLLVGSGLLIRSFARLRGVDPGFRVENLLTASVSLPSDKYMDGEQQLLFFQRLKAAVEAVPGVEGVALVNRLPVLHPWANYRIWTPEQVPEGQAPTADRRIVLPGYFDVMDIELLEGRALNEHDVQGAPPVVVLTQAASEILYPGESSVGRKIVVDRGGEERTTVEVVGIVEDHQLTSLSRLTKRPGMFFPFAQLQEATMRLAVASGVEPLGLIRPIQEKVWELDGDIVLSRPQTMEDALSATVAASRSITTVLSLFSVVALALTSLGLYGLLAFYVARRRHEIGIRIALGAKRDRVLSQVVRQGMLLVGTGSALGIAASFGATRLVRGMLFQVGANDPITLASVSGVFLLVALGACLLPAWRALRVDPVEAFRSE